jgi:glycosyltransferase involved in cell wall biosynthesis
MTVKVLFHLNQLGYGGTEKAILTFCQNLDREKFTPYLFIYDSDTRIKYFRYLTLSKLSSRHFKRYKTKYIDSRARLPCFIKSIGRENIFTGDCTKFKEVTNNILPDIIHFNRGKWEPFYSDLIESCTNSAACVETNIFGYPAPNHYLARLKNLYFVSNWLLKKSNWCENKCKVLYNPIKKPCNKESIRKYHGIPDDAFVFGRISRPDLTDDGFILDVFNQVKKTQKNAYLIIFAGSDIMRSAARNNTSIKLINATTDENILSNFYNSIDVLLHYRIDGETFGMNIAEAMIHGKPVISHYSHIDNAQAELLANTPDHGEVGFVAKRNNMDEYIYFMDELMTSPEKVKLMGENARRRALELFSEDTVTRYLESEYMRVLKQVKRTTL